MDEIFRRLFGWEGSILRAIVIGSFLGLLFAGVLLYATLSDTEGGRTPAPPPAHDTARFGTADAAPIAAATVRVRADDGLGSGVVLASHRVLTAHHVVADALNVYVTVDGFRWYWAQILAVDRPNDLAILDVPLLMDRPGASLCQADPPIGSIVIAAGHHLGDPELSLTVGVYTRPNRVSAQVSFGVSGGGAFVEEDGQWRLVGIVVTVKISRAGALWHEAGLVPLDRIRAFVDANSRGDSDE